MKENKYEGFEIQKVHRRRIHGADYNPRKISKEARARLKAFIKRPEFGLLSPLIWNEATGSLVGGHQRLGILDDLMRTDEYELTVAVVRLSEEDEIRANIQLNNPNVQGEWDYEILTSMKDLGDFDFQKDFGFGAEEIELIFGPSDDEIAEIVDESNAAMEVALEGFERKRAPVEEDDTETDGAKAEQYRLLKKETREKAKIANADGVGFDHAKADFCLTVVFDTAEEKRTFLEMMSRNPAEKRITAEALLDFIAQIT
jgi:hypothetical protein